MTGRFRRKRLVHRESRVMYAMGRMQRIFGGKRLQERKPFPLSSFSRWTSNVPRRRHGLYFDEIHCSCYDGRILGFRFSVYYSF